MKILLLVPTMRYKDPKFTPLSMSDFPTGLAYIASSLKEAGHQVFGLNLNNDTRYPTKILMVTNRISQTIEQVKPDLIGIGGICIDYAFIRDAIEIIRLVCKIPIVLGGGIVNNDAEYIFNLLKPDFCIIGEAEETIVKLADMIQSGKKDFESINNIGYWREE